MTDDELDRLLATVRPSTDATGRWYWCPDLYDGELIPHILYDLMEEQGVVCHHKVITCSYDFQTEEQATAALRAAVELYKQRRSS